MIRLVILTQDFVQILRQGDCFFYRVEFIALLAGALDVVPHSVVGLVAVVLRRAVGRVCLLFLLVVAGLAFHLVRDPEGRAA